MSVYTDLLFMHGHIANVELARQLAGSDATTLAANPRATAAPDSARLNERGIGAAGGNVVSREAHVAEAIGTCTRC